MTTQCPETAGVGAGQMGTGMGADDALGSGPICTITQDVASLMISVALIGILVI